MIKKYVLDEQKDDKQTIKELVAKVNELISTTSGQTVDLQKRREYDKRDHVRFIESTGQRLQSGPMALLYQADPNALTKAMQTTLTVFQEAVQVYRQSIES